MAFTGGPYPQEFPKRTFIIVVSVRVFITALLVIVTGFTLVFWVACGACGGKGYSGGGGDKSGVRVGHTGRLNRGSGVVMDSKSSCVVVVLSSRDWAPDRAGSGGGRSCWQDRESVLRGCRSNSCVDADVVVVIVVSNGRD